MDIKVKVADQYDWMGIIESGYTQRFIETDGFIGYVSLFQIHKVTEPVDVDYPHGETIRIVDNGYSWLQFFPTENSHSVTAMFDGAGDVVQWYIDICRNIRLDKRGVPCFDDLFLDIVLLRSGEVIVRDEDELEDALNAGLITNVEYHRIRNEGSRLVEQLQLDEYKLVKLSTMHRDLLLCR